MVWLCTRILTETDMEVRNLVDLLKGQARITCLFYDNLYYKNISSYNKVQICTKNTMNY